MPQISRIKLFVCLSLLRALLLFFPEAKRLCCVNSSKRGCNRREVHALGNVLVKMNYKSTSPVIVDS